VNGENNPVSVTGITRSTGPALPRRRRGESDRRREVLTTRVGLQMPADLTFEVWQRAGSQLAGVVDSSCWWLGDWLVYGKDHFAGRYQLGIRAAGLKYQTLRNYAWVSRRFALHRRRSGLTFQHHAEVASLPVDKQELWLTETERNEWTTKQLRSAIRAADTTNSAESHHLDAARRLALPGNRIEVWNKAAAHSGVEFEEWVLVTLDHAAERVLQQ
jgi:hypothetical protein